MDNEYKDQLYPNDNYIPDKDDQKKLKELIQSILTGESRKDDLINRGSYGNTDTTVNVHSNTDAYLKVKADSNVNIDSNLDNEIDVFIKSIYTNNPKAAENFKWMQETKIDVIKGSVYKIKKYFLENNYLKDIRGGSKIISELNDKTVKDVLNNEEYNKGIFSDKNIIYSGGGNVLIAVPEGAGRDLCRNLEEEFFKKSLTAMNAFEYVTADLKDFAYNFKDVSRKVNDKLQERKKLKIYSTEVKVDKAFDNEHFANGKYKLIQEDEIKESESVVCSLCDIRNARYYIENENINLCPSCMLKHMEGGQKSSFVEEYKDILDTEDEPKSIGSIDELGDEIAVIYGDGNNMGDIVMNISNVFEMMYFSRNLDIITKKSVYESIKEAFDKDNFINKKHDKVKFEVIALGGDDIFIIVPAKYAFDISSNIIDKFDKSFSKGKKNSKITMSIGMVIAKSNTPIASLAAIAQDKLKSAKKITRGKDVYEGSIDITELLGSNHISENNNREFPMLNSRFKHMREVLQKSRVSQSQLNKISYARDTMIEQEFNLFYYYQESKSRGRNNKNVDTVDGLIKDLYEGFNNVKRCNPYSIDWNDIILIKKRA